MKYTKENLQDLLKNSNIAPETIELVIRALDNDIATREDAKKESESKEKRSRGRPRKYPPKEIDPDKTIDPKYARLSTIRTNPTTIKLTNIDTGEVTTYGSLYKAYQETQHGCGFFERNKEKVVDRMLIEVTK